MSEANILNQYGLFINGEFVPASDGGTFKSTNPATGETLATLAEASKEDVDRAVKAARAAFPVWSKTSPVERQNVLLKIADIIDANLDRLALIETLDNGKPIRETKSADIPLGSDHFRYFAGCLRAWEGSAVMLDDQTLSMILHEPVGVVGQVIPWNFPFTMACWKLAPALAAGNTVVIKECVAVCFSIRCEDQMQRGGVVALHTHELVVRHWDDRSFPDKHGNC